jgi:hypothetical protein
MAMAVPLRKAMRATSQTVTTLNQARAARRNASSIMVVCVASSRLRLLTRSAMTPPKEGEEQKRNGAAEADNAEPESGVVGEREDEPALGHILHPGADVGEKIAAPEEAEVGIAEGPCDLRKAAVLLVGEGRSCCGGFFDGKTGRGFAGSARGLVEIVFAVRNTRLRSV